MQVFDFNTDGIDDVQLSIEYCGKEVLSIAILSDKDTELEVSSRLKKKRFKDASDFQSFYLAKEIMVIYYGDIQKNSSGSVNLSFY